MFFLLFTKETTSVGEVLCLDLTTPARLRFIPAVVLSALITGIGFLTMSYFLYLIHYPCFEKWLW